MAGRQFSKRAQESGLGQLVDSVIRARSEDHKVETGSELDFILSPQGLGLDLYPMQRLIVKATFGIPLDYKPVKVPIWDAMKARLLYEFTEEEAIHWLFEEGKCNVRDWQDIPAKGFSTVVSYAGRRGGKLLDVEEVIPTPTGFKRNGDLQDGDEVLGEDGKTYQVTCAHPIQEEEAYRVEFDDGTHTFAHAGHLWHTYTHRERKNLRRNRCAAEVIQGAVRTTQEILDSLQAPTPKGESNHAISLADPIVLPDQNLPVDPYCLGLWLGECATLQVDDAAHILSQFTAAGYTWTTSPNDLFLWCSLKIKTPLREFGVIGKKHVPHQYLWASQAQRLALLQGLMDSGGTCAEDGRVELCSAFEYLARAVYHLAASLGIKPLWSEERSTLYGKDCGPRYRVTWTSTVQVFRLPRKAERIPRQTRPRVRWRYITGVFPVGKMQMRCIATSNPTHLYLFGRNFNVTHNSEIVAAIGGTMLRNLLMIEAPQKHYDLPPGSPIDFSFMGTDDTGAKRIYTKLRQRINGAPFFSPYIRTNNLDEMSFVTQADRNNRDVLPSILVKAYPCTTQAARGPSNYFLTLDEFQFFRSSKETNSSDMYKAATPSTAQFAPHDDKESPDSKVLVISSASNKIGKMYELHSLGLQEGTASGIFTIRLSTVELNPRIPREWLHKELKQNADTFRAEIGGEFLDATGSYVPEVQVEDCIDRGRGNQTRFSLSTIGRKYFWGFDLGMKHDATALAIGHLEMVEETGVVLIFDYIDRMMVGERFEGPGVAQIEEMQKYVEYKELDVVDIVTWLFHMHQILPCYRGLTDQHSGAHFKQLLQINGITTMELKHLNDQINSQMYFALRGFVNHGACRFPDVPKFITEFKMLEASFKSKYTLRVEAPSEKGAHDDMADAAALVALQAQQWLDEEGKLDLDPSGRTLQVNPNLLPPVPISDVNGVALRDLQIMDRMRAMNTRPTMSARDLQRGTLSRRRR